MEPDGERPLCGSLRDVGERLFMAALGQTHQQRGLSGQVSPRPRAEVHVPALPTVYLCSLRALQR